MSEGVIIAIITGILAIILLYMQNKQATKMAELTKSQEDLHKQINSRMDELLELTRQKGVEQGKIENQAATDNKEQKDK